MSLPNLKSPCSKNPCPLVLGHVWRRRPLIMGDFLFFHAHDRSPFCRSSTWVVDFHNVLSIYPIDAILHMGVSIRLAVVGGAILIGLVTFGRQVVWIRWIKGLFFVKRRLVGIIVAGTANKIS